MAEVADSDLVDDGDERIIMRSLSKLTMGVVACVISGLLVVSAIGTANGADQDTWGYTTTPKNPNGSLNFSGPEWTSLGYPGAGVFIDSMLFSRGGVDYRVDVRVPDTHDAVSLVANTIHDLTNSATWTYSYWYGDASTSFIYCEDSTTTRRAMFIDDDEYFTKSQTGDLSIALAASMNYGGGSAPFLDYSAVVDITSDGSIVHHTTFTNVSGATIEGLSCWNMVDTELNGADSVPIHANGASGVYIGASGFMLYMDLLLGDQILAGSYGNRTTLTNYVAPAGHPQGSVLVSGIDTAVQYGLNARDLAPGESMTIAWSERLFPAAALGQVNIRFIDEMGATVTPEPGFTANWSGTVGDPVGFTEVDALVGVPLGYDFESIDNVSVYTAYPQTITVHLTQQLRLVPFFTTRTITYVGAGSLTPVEVVQIVDWFEATSIATGEVSYILAAGGAAVMSPAVEGFTASARYVQGISSARTTVRPVDSTVVVTYTVTPAVPTGGTSQPSSLALSLGLGLALMGGVLLRRRVAAI